MRAINGLVVGSHRGVYFTSRGSGSPITYSRRLLRGNPSLYGLLPSLIVATTNTLRIPRICLLRPTRLICVVACVVPAFKSSSHSVGFDYNQLQLDVDYARSWRVPSQDDQSTQNSAVQLSGHVRDVEVWQISSLANKDQPHSRKRIFGCNQRK